MSFVQTGFRGVAGAVRRNRFEAAFLTAFFVLMSALAFLFPRSGDDWAWGSQTGLDRLAAHFHNYNGRYAGDLAIIGLTRISVLAPILVGATLALTIFLILDLTDNRSLPGYLLTVLLFFLMPLETWQQSVVWLSGYSNYGIAGLCLLVYLRSVKREWVSGSKQRPGIAHLALIVCFGFVAALFMEHVTLYLVAASVLFLVWFRIRFRRFSARSLAWAGSFIAGAAVMFSNGAYRAATAASSLEKPVYQQIHATHRPPLHTLVKKAGDTISSEAVTHNVALNIVLILLACLLTTTAGSSARRAKAAVLGLAALYLTLTTSLSVVENNLTLRLAWRLLSGVAALILVALLVVVALSLVTDLSRRVGVLVCLASFLVLIAPLVLVDPVGPRCFYPTYLVFLIIMNVLVKEVSPDPDGPVMSRAAPFLGVVVTGVLVTYFVIYGIQHHAASERLAQIRQAEDRGATAVTVKRLPFHSYAWIPDPSNAFWAHRFKVYYDLPDSLQITLTHS
ncbi:MAG: DUF6056 family protein [Actinomycetota bacterium]|nr:DUF6056 family protein [Actinomycetota bacterium]